MPNLIVVTKDFFDERKELTDSFDSILNDYYENTIEELPKKDQILAKKFIEEGLIVEGRRVGVTEGVEKVQYNIEKQLLDNLLKSRLIRAENTHLGKSYEVSHDVLVGPITDSYEKRQIQEEAELRRLEKQKVRKRLLQSSIIGVVGLLLVATGSLILKNAYREQEKAILEMEKVKKELVELRVKRRENVIESCQLSVKKIKSLMNYAEFIAAELEAKKAIQDIQVYQKEIEGEASFEEMETCLQEIISLQTVIKQNSNQKTQFDELLNQANKSSLKGDLLVARRYYQQALKFEMNENEVKNAYEANEIKLRKDYNLFIDNANKLFDLAKKTGKKNNYEDALEYYDKAIARFPLEKKEAANRQLCLAKANNNSQ